MPRLNAATRRLRSTVSAHRERVIASTDAVALAVDRAIAGVWRRLMTVLSDPHAVLLLLHRLPHTIATELRHQLAGLYLRAHQAAAANVLHAVAAPVRESRESPTPLQSEILLLLTSFREKTLVKDLASWIPNFSEEEVRAALAALVATGQVTGSTQTGYEAVPDVVAALWPTVRTPDFAPAPAAPTAAIDPAPSLTVSPDLFSAPSFADVLAWLSRFVQPDPGIGTDTDKRMPADLAQTIATQTSQGKTQGQVAKEIRPFLDGSRMRARRAARTFGLHVAHTAQLQAWDGLGEMLVGYTVHSVKGPTTRKWHRDRDGTSYYRDPAPGQKGLRQCPHPPLEAEDPAERPPGTPQIAWHCLCWLTPIISP